jgi:DNA-binding transcriptional regulator LsrR (DeoR family)
MYELLIRNRVILETTDNSFAFQLTQEELADATGMTPIHTNRVLQQLRSEGLIELKNRILTILEPERLREVAQFDSTYLHLDRTERGDREVAGRAGDLLEESGDGLIKDGVDKVKSLFGRGNA